MTSPTRGLPSYSVVGSISKGRERRMTIAGKRVNPVGFKEIQLLFHLGERKTIIESRSRCGFLNVIKCMMLYIVIINGETS